MRQIINDIKIGNHKLNDNITLTSKNQTVILTGITNDICGLITICKIPDKLKITNDIVNNILGINKIIIMSYCLFKTDKLNNTQSFELIIAKA